MNLSNNATFRLRNQLKALQDLCFHTDPLISARAKSFLEEWPIPQPSARWDEFIAFRRTCHLRRLNRHNVTKKKADGETVRGKRQAVWCPDRLEVIDIRSDWQPPEWLSNPNLLPKRPPGK